MISTLVMLASVLTVNLPSSECAEVFVSGLPDGDPESSVSSAAVKQLDGLTVLDFCPTAGTNGLVRNFFRDDAVRSPDDYEHRFREMTLMHSVDPKSVFLRDSTRTFGPAYLPSRICRCLRNGVASLGTLIVRSDALYGEEYVNGVEADWDVVLDGRVVSGDDRAWKELTRISMEEGFGPEHTDNWLRLQGCNETGTSNLEYPVLIDTRSLMVCALVCDFCESVPDVYAYRSRVQPGMSRSGFVFVIGERSSRTGSSIPLLIHRQLLQDDEYCRGYADLIHEACERPNGELTPESCARRVDRRIAETRAACGDEIDAAKAVDGFERLKRYLAERGRKYVAESDLSKLLSVPAPLGVDDKGAPLPAYGRYRGKVELKVKPGVGKVYYSDSGCDPRDEAGEVSPLAAEYNGPFEVNGRCRLRARTLTPEGEWSALEMVNLNLQ